VANARWGTTLILPYNIGDESHVCSHDRGRNDAISSPAVFLFHFALKESTIKEHGTTTPTV
jgi:hypothetical protein